jgi:hypothetical protein
VGSPRGGADTVAGGRSGTPQGRLGVGKGTGRAGVA